MGEKEKEVLVYSKYTDDWSCYSVLNKYLENKVGLMSIMDMHKYKLWVYSKKKKRNLL